MGIVSGMVYDENSLPIGNAVVYALRLDTGALLGEAMSSDGAGPGPADPGADNLSLMLQFQGEVGTQAFVDSGPLQHIITPLSDINLIDTNPAFAATPTTASFSSVNSKRLLVPAHACFDLPGDFTVLARWRSDSTPSMVFFTSESLATGTWYAEIMYMGQSVLVFGERGGQNTLMFGPVNISSYSWHEVLFTRSNGQIYCLLNGQSVSLFMGNAANNTAWASDSTQNRIGGVDGDTYSTNCQLAEFAIYKGLALHTENYTPLTRLRNLVSSPPIGQYSIDCGSYNGKVICTAKHPTNADARPLVLRTTPV